MWSLICGVDLGYLPTFSITKLSSFFAGRWPADLTALALPSAFFGYRHACYQGLLGAFMTGGEGFAFCVFYLWFGHTNVLPLIFAHGIFHTLGQTFRHLEVKNVDLPPAASLQQFATPAFIKTYC